jgi:hypothetical protein
MQNNFFKAGLLALFLIIAFIVGYEAFWRSRGMPVSFNDDDALWANKRHEIYQPADKATVFIGSSRIKFDLDIPTWEKITGEKAIQLALVGTNPVPLLEDLAADEKFKGKLIVDVTEGLFFSLSPQNDASAEKGIKYFKNETPSQNFSNKVGYLLESNFVFLEENKYAVNALLNDMALKNRKGVFAEPPFPKGFEMTNYDRQTYMTDEFVNDSSEVKRMTDIWMFFASLSRKKAIDGDTLQQYLSRVKTAVDRLKGRGVKIVFVRTPASGPMEIGMKKGYPREQYWEQLLKHTNTPGIHYEDYPETSKFICPEWSHLKLSDAKIYTAHLVKTLQQETGWTFTNNPLQN